MYINEINPFNINEIKEEISTTTDRACAIVAASFIDDQLSAILSIFLLPGSSKENNALFEGNAPLATFSNKIKCAIG